MVRQKSQKKKTNIKTTLTQKRKDLKKDEIKLSCYNFPKVKVNTSAINNNYLINNFNNIKNENCTSQEAHFSIKNSIICANIINTIYQYAQSEYGDYTPIDGYETIQKLYLPKSKTMNELYGVILRDNSKKNLIIAFRGILTNHEWKLAFQYFPKDYKGEYFVEGFLKIYLHFKNDIERIIEENINLNLWITGFSAGGAVASIAEFLLSKKNYQIKGITFGSPRSLCGDCISSNKNFYRVINLNDSIPWSIPAATTDQIYNYSGYPIIFNYTGKSALDNHSFYLTELITGNYKTL